MFNKVFLISIIHFYFCRTLICVHHFGHEVGGTSMESTHYDRRIFQQQCSINDQMKEQYQVIYRTNFKSSSSSTTTNTTINNNRSSLILFQKRLISNLGEDRLVTRVSSDTIDINNTVPLNMDQSSVDIIVDKQVRVDMYFALLHFK